MQLALLAASAGAAGDNDAAWQPVRAWRRRCAEPSNDDPSAADHVDDKGTDEQDDGGYDSGWWTGCAVGGVAYDYNVLTTELRERPALLSLFE